MDLGGITKLTPTQLASHERSKAFREKIKERAAQVVVPERRSWSIPNTPFGVPKIAPAAADKVVFVSPPAPEHPKTDPWFSIVAEIGEPSGRPPTIIEIQRAVCRYFDIRRIDFLSGRRPKELSGPRQIAYFIAKDLTGNSLPMIGRQMGDRDHTTILHGFRKIARLLPISAALAFDVAMIARSLIGDRPQ